MSRFVWLTDLHLNHCERDDINAFLQNLLECEPDGVLITGDFSESTHLIGYLDLLANSLPLPIYFVLGNHDFYFSSIEQIRKEVREFCLGYKNLHYLTDDSPISLTSEVSLLGEDGWADGRIGNYEGSFVRMHDYRVIENLSGLDKEARWHLLKSLGDQAAERARQQLEAAIPKSKKLLLLTHIPPFREACWYQGQISDDQWAPHFTSKAMGEMLVATMKEHLDRELVVLCGHTHGEGIYRCLPNLTVYTGKGEYRELHIAGWLNDQLERFDSPSF